VSEGRDNLAGDGLVSVASDLSLGKFTFAPWIAHGYDSDYSELNLHFLYSTQLAHHLEVYAGSLSSFGMTKSLYASSTIAGSHSK
jgi:hypothetical protein